MGLGVAGLDQAVLDGLLGAELIGVSGRHEWTAARESAPPPLLGCRNIAILAMAYTI
jgi:hypothetical protein